MLLFRLWCVRGNMLRLVLLVVAAVVAEMVSGCRWVCVDKRNTIMMEYFDTSKLEMEYRKNVITVPKIGRKRHSLTYDKPEVLLRMPEIEVEPVQVDCKSKEFAKQLTKMTKKIACLPRDTIVDLKYKGGKVNPPQISTKLCTGVCSLNKSCMSMDRKNVTVAVSIFTKSGAQCTHVKVHEDTKCKCQCKKSADDCQTTQVFDKKFCKCKCINKEDHQNCIKKVRREPDKFTWNRDTCSCQCRNESVCTTGTQWSNDVCRCVLSNKLS